jgi:hypothetical protein
MTFTATKHPVSNRGIPPDSFLTELVTWAKTADDAIFAPNDVSDDIYSRIKPQLGPWTGPLHRRAAMLEALRVLAAFESSFRWDEGRDTSAGQESPSQMETGAWQVSADSLSFGSDLWDCVQKLAPGAGDDHCLFQSAMKSNHPLACTYIARLLRHTVRANGPIVRNEILPWLRRDAVLEFQSLIG